MELTLILQLFIGGYFLNEYFTNKRNIELHKQKQFNKLEEEWNKNQYYKANDRHLYNRENMLDLDDIFEP